MHIGGPIILIDIKRNKMTAVEFLANVLSKQIDSNLFMEVEFDKLLDQAKEMEKEQMHAEYMRGWKDGLIKQGPPTPPLDRKIYK